LGGSVEAVALNFLTAVNLTALTSFLAALMAVTVEFSWERTKSDVEEKKEEEEEVEEWYIGERKRKCWKDLYIA
jgi:hypothetical protein